MTLGTIAKGVDGNDGQGSTPRAAVDLINPLMQMANAGQLSSFRNKLINGRFDFWQRGASFSSPSNVYTADRWKVSASAAASVSRQAFAAGQTDVPGNPKYFLRMDCSNAPADPTLFQPVEDVTQFDNVKVRLSFYAKADAAITYSEGGYFIQNFGSGGSAAVIVNIGAFTLSTSWQRFEKTITMPSISGKTLGTDHYCSVRFDPTNATATIFDIAMVQVEIPDQSNPLTTPFEQRPYAVELALCQRYFEKSFAVDVTPAQALGANTGEHTFGAQRAGAIVNRGAVVFQQRKKSAPTITIYNPEQANAQARDQTAGADCSSTAVLRNGEHGFAYSTTGNAASAQNNRIGLHWTASAEL